MSATTRSLKHVIAIRHVHFEDLGTFEDVLNSRGMETQYLEAGMDELSAIAPDGPDLLAVLGGPIGAYEEDVYPWLRDIKTLLAERIERGLPTLGICLGAQLIASALGARVFPGDKRELGWGTINVTEQGMTSPLKYLSGSDYRVLHWHGDTFDLPDGATLLASSELYRHQAFSVGANVLGIQFHPEVREHGFDRWLIGHALEIASTPGQNAGNLRQEMTRYARALARQASGVFNEWLDNLV